MSSVDWDSLKEFFKEKTGLCYYNTGKTELVTRCHYKGCEVGSKKTHGHLYIKTEEGEPFFNCFKCNHSGILPNLIIEYNGIPTEYFDKLEIKKNVKKQRTITIKDETEVKYIIPDIKEADSTKKKNYLYDRLGNDYPIDKIPGLIFNFKQFIEDNQIKINEKQERLLDFINGNFIGFLTSKKTKIICRNSDNKSDFRYYNFLLNTKNDVRDFYGIKTKEPDCNNDKILMCEGIFDLLRTFKNDDMNHLRNDCFFWAAILCNKYSSAIKPILSYCKVPKLNIVILSDNNIKESNYSYVKYNNMVNNVEIYWNKLGNDFGSKNVEFSKSHYRYRRKRINKNVKLRCS